MAIEAVAERSCIMSKRGVEVFEEEIERLSSLVKEIGRIHLRLEGRESYMPLVDEYNRILDDLLDRGLSEPLDFEIELPSDLISKRYLAMNRRRDFVEDTRQPVAYLLGGSPFIVPVRVPSELSLGRCLDSDVVLLHKATSRCHAILQAHRDGTITLRDRESKNNTYLNGARVGTEAEPVPQDALLDFGGALVVFLSLTPRQDVLPPKLLNRLRDRMLGDQARPPEDPFLQGGIWKAVDDPSETVFSKEDERETENQSPSLHGNIRLGILPLLLFFLLQSRLTGDLRFTGTASSARMLIVDGALTYCVCGTQAGLDAVYASTVLETGVYEFHLQESIDNSFKCITTPPHDIILRCCAHLCEFLRDRVRRDISFGG